MKRRVRFFGGPWQGKIREVDVVAREDGSVGLPRMITMLADDPRWGFASSAAEAPSATDVAEFVDYFLDKRTEGCGVCPKPMFVPQWETAYVTSERRNSDNVEMGTNVKARDTILGLPVVEIDILLDLDDWHLGDWSFGV